MYIDTVITSIHGQVNSEKSKIEKGDIYLETHNQADLYLKEHFQLL